MTDPAQDRRVDELRRQLRALGYLDAGVNRFVLRPATDTRRPVAIAILASLRVGILAAVLLGPAAAIGLNARLPGLVTGPRDAFVIAVYLGVLFGAGISLVAVMTSLAVAALAGERLARRGRPLARAAGATVALACLAYLTLWWRTANAGLGWAAPVWTAFALAIAVAISLLLGHVAASAAFAVIIARRGHGDVQGDSIGLPITSSRWGWKTTLAAALVAFAGAGALLVVTAPRHSATSERVPLAVVSGGLRLRVIAIDGVDPGVLDELAASGRLPALGGALTGTRARLSLDDSDTPRDPARSWTTIATGRSPDAHGVRGIETRRVAGVQGTLAAGERTPLGGAIRTATDLVRLTRPAIASGHERRVKTMWEVASAAGLRTAVINWWATWPASSDADGIVLSDRSVLRLERGGVMDAEIAPAPLYERLRARWPAIRAEAGARARTASASLAWGESETRAALERSAELDAIQLVLMRDVSTPQPDLSVVYLPGLDISQNTLLGRRDAALAPSVVAARLQALRDYYIFLDRLLTDVIAPGEMELVIVVTEPGRVTAASDGLMGVLGNVVATKGSDRRGRVMDVAPTILHALGVPISRELTGEPLSALFNDDFMRRYPVRQVETYGRPSAPSPGRGGQPLDQEMIDRLRSLGYVK